MEKSSFPGQIIFYTNFVASTIIEINMDLTRFHILTTNLGKQYT